MRLQEFKDIFITGANDTAHALGFDSWANMIENLFIIRDYSLTIRIAAISFCVGLFTWIENWVFAPAYTYIIFIAVTLAESLFGTVKNIWKYKEKFNLDKAVRIVPKILAHTFALSCAWHMSKADPLFSWMPSTVFVFFTSQNFLKAILHLVDLGWMDGNFANFIRSKFTSKEYFTDQKSDQEDSKDQEDANNPPKEP